MPTDVERAEAAVDGPGLIRALDGAKDRVERAIRAEARRAIRRAGTRNRVELALTEGMITPLVALYRRGRREARREARVLGYALGVRLAAGDPADLTTVPDGLGGVVTRLQSGLADLGAKLTRARDDAVRAAAAGAGPGVEIGEAISRGIGSAAGRLLDRVPGARDVASQLVSESLFSGLGDVYAANADAFGGYVYTAMLDDGTCEVCRPLNGRRYRTLAELYVDLPNFGPNPRCRGGYRCRCRGVPLPPI